MKYTKSLTNFRSLRYLFLLLTRGVVAIAFAAANTPVQTQAALQSPTRQHTQSTRKPALPNYDIRLAGKTGFDDFDLNLTSGRARAQQNAHVRSRLAAVDQFLNARPDAAQNLHAMANETGAMKNLFVDGGTLSEPESDTPDNIARRFLNRHVDLFAIKSPDNPSLKLMKEDNDQGTVFLDYTQTVAGIKVFQGQVQVVVNKNGEVLSVREGFLVDNQQVRLKCHKQLPAARAQPGNKVSSSRRLSVARSRRSSFGKRRVNLQATIGSHLEYQRNSASNGVFHQRNVFGLANCHGIAGTENQCRSQIQSYLQYTKRGSKNLQRVRQRTTQPAAVHDLRFVLLLTGRVLPEYGQYKQSLRRHRPQFTSVVVCQEQLRKL